MFGRELPVDVSGHAEVGYLDDPAGALGGEETVAGSDVPMDEVVRLQVLAPFGYIHGARQQVPHRQRRGSVLWVHTAGVRSVVWGDG